LQAGKGCVRRVDIQTSNDAADDDDKKDDVDYSDDARTMATADRTYSATTNASSPNVGTLRSTASSS